MKDKILSFLEPIVQDKQPSIKGDSLWLQCPHPDHPADSTPSFKVALEGEYAGAYYCFGCGIHGGWNKLCNLLSLTKEAKYLIQDRAATLYTAEDEEKLFGELITKDKANVEEWPNQSWRGIKYPLLKAVGAKAAIFHNDMMLRFIVKVRSKNVGHIDCVIQPKPDTELKYINKKGTWVKDALFPYDYVNSLNVRHPILFIVEGPRDALVTIQNGYPALAILGTNNWSDKCASLIISLAPDLVVIMLDPDDAGIKAQKHIYNDLKDMLNVKVVNLPRRKLIKEKDGKKIVAYKKKLDPANLTSKMLQKIVNRLTGDSNGTPHSYANHAKNNASQASSLTRRKQRRDDRLDRTRKSDQPRY